MMKNKSALIIWPAHLLAAIILPARSRSKRKQNKYLAGKNNRPIFQRRRKLKRPKSEETPNETTNRKYYWAANENKNKRRCTLLGGGIYFRRLLFYFSFRPKAGKIKDGADFFSFIIFSGTRKEK